MPRRAARVSRKQTFSSKKFVAYTYQPASKKRFSASRAVQTIRQRLQSILDTGPREGRVWIRAKGGRPRYRNSWWSSPELDPKELSKTDDNELRDFLGGLDDPWVLDIISAKKRKRRPPAKKHKKPIKRKRPPARAGR